MTQFLQLVRYKNLLFLAFIQLAMQQLVITPILQKYGFDYQPISDSTVLLLVATLCIAAAGYIINDYFDIKTDRINRPEKVLVTTYFSKKTASVMHQVLTGVGMLSGFLLAWYLRSITLGILFITVPGLLWFYSASYKRQFLTGNLVVALLAGLSVLITGIVAVAELQKTFAELLFETTIPREIYTWTGAFALFAFLLTLIRELIKDMEDAEGDAEIECRTVAIVWGAFKTKVLITGLVLLTIGLLLTGILYYLPFEGQLSLKYMLFTVIVPLAVLTVLLFRATDKAALHTASALAKYIMVAGVLYAFVFYYLLAKAYGLSLFNILVLKQV